MSLIIIITIFLIFLYFGYIKDYRNDKNGFKKTTIFVVGLFSVSVFAYFLGIKFSDNIKEKVHQHYWALEKNDKSFSADTSIEQQLIRSIEVKAKVDSVMNKIKNVYIIFLSISIYLLNKWLKRKYG
jgi:uncharacterized protein YktB (UPF0637 family)